MSGIADVCARRRRRACLLVRLSILMWLVWVGSRAAKGAQSGSPPLTPQGVAQAEPPVRSSAFQREFQSALASYEAKRYDQARKQLEPWLARLPDSFEVNELMGLVYAGQGQGERANPFLQSAVRLKPGSAVARTNLAVNLVRLGKNALAESQFKKAVEIEPESFDANHNLGEFYVRAGRLPAAIPYLKHAQDVNPSSYENGYDLALACAQTGRYSEARARIQATLEKQDTAELRNLLGEVEEKAGNYLAAEREYERAAHLEPSENNIFDWGSELLLHQAPEPAIEVFGRGLERYPRSAKMEIGLGLAFYARGQYDDAVKALALATDLEPSDPRPYLFLAKAYDVSTTRAEEVTARLRRFAEIEPRNARAQFYYAMSLWKGKRDQDTQPNLDEIESLLKKAIALDPAFPEAPLELGVLYANQRKYPEAIREYERALKLGPDSPDAHYHLAQAYVRTKEKVRAQEEFALYDRLHKQRVADADKQRSEIKQFIYTMKAKGQ
jgi:tetratricopeptide (TPR) repeat protein